MNRSDYTYKVEYMENGEEKTITMAAESCMQCCHHCRKLGIPDGQVFLMERVQIQ